MRELPGPKPKKYRRPAKPRTARFRPDQRVMARFGTRTPSGAWVSRGARGTVVGIDSSRTRFVVRWDDHPRETGYYSEEDLEGVSGSGRDRARRSARDPRQMSASAILSLVETSATTAEHRKFYAVYDRALRLHGREGAARIASAAVNLEAMKRRGGMWA